MAKMSSEKGFPEKIWHHPQAADEDGQDHKDHAEGEEQY